MLVLRANVALIATFIEAVLTKKNSEEVGEAWLWQALLSGSKN